MASDDEHDIGNGHYDVEDDEHERSPRTRELPSDLPRSLDDRKNFPSYNQETEYYDAWQGEQ